MRCPFSEQLRICMHVCVCVCARAHILHGILYRMRRVCEHSGNPPCVSANIQRMQLSIPATGHLSAPLFFSYWHVPWEKTNWPAFISALTMDSFFFFFYFLWYMLHGRVYVYAPVCVAALFLNIVIIFCRFFFFEKERWFLQREGQIFMKARVWTEGLDGTMRILSSHGLFNNGGPRCKWI